MKLLVQWALSEASDWIAVDSSAWADLPYQPDPTPAEGEKRPELGPEGWVNAMCVQGICLRGDHYAAWHEGDVVVVVTWESETAEHNSDPRRAWVWRILPLAPDPVFDGRYNTRQSLTVYAEEPLYSSLAQHGIEGGRVLPWSEFVFPAEALTRHGYLMSDELWAAHEAALTHHSWREWTDSVPEEDLDEGGQVSPTAKAG